MITLMMQKAINICGKYIIILLYENIYQSFVLAQVLLRSTPPRLDLSFLRIENSAK